MREDLIVDLFYSDLECEILRVELEDLVGEENIFDLVIGDEIMFEEYIEDCLERFYVVKVYLQSDVVLVNSVVMEYVFDEIVNEEIDV